MLTTKQEILFKLASSFSLPKVVEPTLEELSIPRDYICLEGFRLKEKPSQSLKVLFLGDLGGLGNQRLKLCPSLEWLFHESDKVIMDLSSVIAGKYHRPATKRHTSLEAFQNFCSQVIPEKIIFNLQNDKFEDAAGPQVRKTMDIIHESKANFVGGGEESFLELVKGLHYQNGAVLQAGRQLMFVGGSAKGPLPVKMSGEKLAANSLGSFASVKKGEKPGLAVQVEFSLYDQWRIERVSWRKIHSETGPKRVRLFLS